MSAFVSGFAHASDGDRSERPRLVTTIETQDFILVFIDDLPKGATVVTRSDPSRASLDDRSRRETITIDELQQRRWRIACDFL
jgi:hypothetical protein